MAARHDSDGGEYSLGAVVRLTGLSEHTLRAWERRYGAVQPGRSPKGTRRYSQAEIERLRLLHAAVQAGHRIGDVAGLSDQEIEARLDALPAPASRPLDEVRAAIARLDPGEVERLLGIQLAALGNAGFCREIALPLLHEVGTRWEHGEGSVASEHLLTSATRGLLGAALRAAPRLADAPRLLFTTPEDERHELGALIAAVTAAGAGADVTYLGPELPVEEVVAAASATQARAVGLSIVTLPGGAARRYLERLRRALPEAVALWLGGAGAAETTVPGAEHLELDELARAVARLVRRARVAT